MRSFKICLVLLLATLATGPALLALELTSSDVSDGATMDKRHEFQGFGCDGENLSPALAWSDVPDGTKSFAVTAYDPDAPTGSGWWHWVVFNLPADTRGLPRNAGDPEAGLLPAGAVQSRTDFGAPGYGGPCPPEGHGVHHYHFKVYALDVPSLELVPDSPAALVGYMLNAHRVDSAEIVGLYERK